MNSGMNGFHAILLTLKKKLSSSTLSCRCTLRSRNETRNSKKIHAEGIYLPQNLETVTADDFVDSYITSRKSLNTALYPRKQNQAVHTSAYARSAPVFHGSKSDR
ncbi:putative ammonium transporter [Trichinella spiralis]|uniref:Ammonium transporter n=1 Tax=Trichinella spiralis TaxID=6334 RepID=A0ABR3K494_TRISP